MFGCVVGSRNFTALCAAAINMIPNANREIKPVVVGQLDESIERRQIALLLFGSNADHPDIGKASHVEEVGIARREETTVLVTEDYYEGVKPVLRQHIEIPHPIHFVMESASPRRYQ